MLRVNPSVLSVFMIACALLLSACRPVQPVTPGNQPAPPAAAVTNAPTALEEALSGKLKGTTVHFATSMGENGDVPFLQSIKEFTDKSGIIVQYASVDDSLLPVMLKTISAPDIMHYAYLAPLRGLVESGQVVDVAQFIDRATLDARYGKPWMDWATMQGPNGPIIAGVWDRYYPQSLVWYPKKAFDQAGYKVPTTWDEMLALSDQIVADGGSPWCIENSGGWPAGQWVNDILLRTAPPAVAEKWMKGELEFDSPEVKHAVQVMSDLWFRPGYSLFAREFMDFIGRRDVAGAMFASPPQCWLMRETTVSRQYDDVTEETYFRAKTFGQDYDFFVLPSIDPQYGAPVETEAWIYAMFHDRPEVRALMEFFTTGAAQKRWNKSDRFVYAVPHKTATPEWYALDPAVQAFAAVAGAAEQDGRLYYIPSEAMAPAPNLQFYASLQDYVDGKIDLDTALQQSDAAATAPNQ